MGFEFGGVESHEGDDAADDGEAVEVGGGGFAVRGKGGGEEGAGVGSGVGGIGLEERAPAGGVELARGFEGGAVSLGKLGHALVGGRGES